MTLTEAQTREIYIDSDLKRAGWHESEIKREYDLHSAGRADYVLLGRDNIPLAVIEAKRTSKSPVNGMTQAEIYAQALAKQFNQLPKK